MPYTGANDEKLPKNVQELPEKVREQWVAVWNSVYEACMSDEVEQETCETQAFTQANGTIKEDAALSQGTILVTMQENAQDTKEVEILRVGAFVDKHGREIEITTDDLDEFVKNFEAGEAGQDVPFDVDHERKQAVGWLKSLWRAGEKLVGIPEWNARGVELIENKVYRYLSATIDLGRKFIKSISLVNFPAVKGLNPLELGEYMGNVGYHNQKGVYMGEIALRALLHARLHWYFSNMADEMAAHNIVDIEQRKQMSSAIGEALSAFENALGEAGDIIIKIPETEPFYFKEATQMDEQALREQIREEERAKVAAELQERETLEAELREKIRTEERQLMEAHFTKKRELGEFAAVVCSGEVALAAKPEEVVEFLMGLDEAQVETAKTLLQAKVLAFSEIGTSADGQGSKKQLPAEYAEQLRSGQLTLDDLANPILGLDTLSNYDLSEFKSS